MGKVGFGVKPPKAVKSKEEVMKGLAVDLLQRIADLGPNPTEKQIENVYKQWEQDNTLKVQKAGFGKDVLTVVSIVVGIAALKWTIDKFRGKGGKEAVEVLLKQLTPEVVEGFEKLLNQAKEVLKDEPKKYKFFDKAMYLKEQKGLWDLLIEDVKVTEEQAELILKDVDIAKIEKARGLGALKYLKISEGPLGKVKVKLQKELIKLATSEFEVSIEGLMKIGEKAGGTAKKIPKSKAETKALIEKMADWLVKKVETTFKEAKGKKFKVKGKHILWGALALTGFVIFKMCSSGEEEKPKEKKGKKWEPPEHQIKFLPPPAKGGKGVPPVPVKTAQVEKQLKAYSNKFAKYPKVAEAVEGIEDQEKRLAMYFALSDWQKNKKDKGEAVSEEDMANYVSHLLEVEKKYKEKHTVEGTVITLPPFYPKTMEAIAATVKPKFYYKVLDIVSKHAEEYKEEKGKPIGDSALKKWLEDKVPAKWIKK